MKCVLFRVRSAMSQSVERRAFHASGPEQETARSPMGERHLGSRYNTIPTLHSTACMQVETTSTLISTTTVYYNDT